MPVIASCAAASVSQPHCLLVSQAEQLQTVLNMINKKFGKGSIQRLGDNSAPPNM
jgi:hypothetical protein